MGRNSKSRKIITRSESGTCNVCSAPCSSCLHKNGGSIPVKAEESSGETCQENAGNETDERYCDKRAVKNNYEEIKGKEGTEDSTSCVTGGSDFNKLASSDNKSSGARHGLEEFSSKNEFIENSRSEDKKEGVRPSKLPNSKDLKEKLGSKEPLILSSMKEEELAIGEVSLKLEEETNTGNSGASEKNGLEFNSQTQTDNASENQPKKVVNSSVQIKEIGKIESVELSDVQEKNTEAQFMIDSDESDVLEHDVKVCDICGDAGREDKLAICSRCSDGAEHTYCMREMIDKVPEGDWLCEECKSYDKIKSKNTEVASAEDSCLLNIDGKDLDNEGTKIKKKIMGKRDMDDRLSEEIETRSEAKKQSLGPTAESPKAPHRLASLSRDLSLKNPNKGELRPPNNETSEEATSLRGLRQQIVRSTFSKSSSFCTNVKSKADFFNEIPQKQKSARESSYIDKEGSSKLMGRSMSFKPSSSSRLNSSESKVKMLSSKFLHPQDVKGLRPTKPQNLLERKSSFKPESTINTTISNSNVFSQNPDQKPALFDPILSNSSEMKGVLADSKPSTLSRSTSHIARKGEMRIGRVSEQKPRETGLKDDSSSGERIRESFVSRPRISIESPRDIVNDASAARSFADVIKGNKLKAAIEAAMLKKPGVCRKNKPADQTDEVPTPNTNLNSETRTENNLPSPSKKRNMSIIANEVHEEHAISSNEDRNSYPLPIASSGLSIQHSATVPVISKMPVLPEHEYIWQGGFDIRKIGKLANLRDGLQAHLSTFASPNVLEAVNKFPSKLLLNEVSRLSTWPVQFQDSGVKEDNIALYFFAKDLDSYERSYKSLVETMMRRDVALKGNFDGVELLIFPSNHLPQNAQRWNMLYFLWGVFRRKKASVQIISDSNACDVSKECTTTGNLPGLSKKLNADGQKSAALILDGHTSENFKKLCDTKVYPSDSIDQSLRGNVEKKISSLSVPEIKIATTPLEENIETKIKIKTDVASVDAETNISKSQQISSNSGTSARARPSDDSQRRVKNEEEFTDANLFRERNITISGATKEPNIELQLNLGKRLRENPIPEALSVSISSNPEEESANKKQKTDSSIIELADNKIFSETVPNLGNTIVGETKAPKRGFELDLNEAQDYTPDSPIPVVKQEKGCLFDLNIAQDYPPENDDEGESSSLSPPFPCPNKVPEVIPANNMEPVLPGRPNTRSSRFFLDLPK